MKWGRPTYYDNISLSTNEKIKDYHIDRLFLTKQKIEMLSTIVLSGGLDFTDTTA